MIPSPLHYSLTLDDSVTLAQWAADLRAVCESTPFAGLPETLIATSEVAGAAALREGWLLRRATSEDGSPAEDMEWKQT